MPKGEKCPKYVSGNSLKGSNIKKNNKKEKSMRQGKRKLADEKLLICFTWPLSIVSNAFGTSSAEG
jgi:hypothetical protein